MLSQDNNIFPTRGSELLLSVTGGLNWNVSDGYAPEFRTRFAFSKHWSFNPFNIVTLKIGSVPRENEYGYEKNGISLRYSRIIIRDMEQGFIRNSAFYLEHGQFGMEYTNKDGRFLQYSFKTGLIAENPFTVFKLSFSLFIEDEL